MSIEPVPNSLKACLEQYKALLTISNAVERMLTEDLKETEIDNAKLRLEIKRLKGETQEPVAWMNDIAFSMDKELLGTRSRIVPLYTHPAPSWQGLSDDEIAVIIGNGAFYELGDLEFARAIEQALKEKNT